RRDALPVGLLLGERLVRREREELSPAGALGVLADEPGRIGTTGWHERAEVARQAVEDRVVARPPLGAGREAGLGGAGGAQALGHGERYDREERGRYEHLDEREAGAARAGRARSAHPPAPAPVVLWGASGSWKTSRTIESVRGSSPSLSRQVTVSV